MDESYIVMTFFWKKYEKFERKEKGPAYLKARYISFILNNQLKASSHSLHFCTSSPVRLCKPSKMINSPLRGELLLKVRKLISVKIWDLWYSTIAIKQQSPLLRTTPLCKAVLGRSVLLKPAQFHQWFARNSELILCYIFVDICSSMESSQPPQI